MNKYKKNLRTNHFHTSGKSNLHYLYKLNTQRVQYLLSIRPVQTCHPKLQEKPLFKRKKMAPKKPSAHHYGYGWYNEKQLEDYYNKIIGNFFNIVSIAKLTISLCLLHISLR